MDSKVASVKIRPVFDIKYSTDFQPYVSRKCNIILLKYSISKNVCPTLSQISKQEFNDRIAQLDDILKKRSDNKISIPLIFLSIILPIIGHIALIVSESKKNKKVFLLIIYSFGFMYNNIYQIYKLFYLIILDDEFI